MITMSPAERAGRQAYHDTFDVNQFGEAVYSESLRALATARWLLAVSAYEDGYIAQGAHG